MKGPKNLRFEFSLIYQKIKYKFAESKMPELQ